MQQNKEIKPKPFHMTGALEVRHMADIFPWSHLVFSNEFQYQALLKCCPYTNQQEVGGASKRLKSSSRGGSAGVRQG